MNYFLKLRFAIWVIVALSVIILVTVGTMFYFMLSNKGERRAIETRHPPIEHFLQKELGFSPDQEKQADVFRNEYFQHMKPIFTALEQKRITIIEELSKPKPDTLMLNRLSDDCGTLHAQLRRETVKQLLRLRSICKPDQIEKLNILNKKLIMPEGPMHRRREEQHHN
jgi:hypothetical protein